MTPGMCCATGSLEHETLIRRTVDEERNPARVAALATGLGMSYRETIAACAQIGLDHAFTAQVAVTRRHGDIAQASADLAAGWTAPPPRDGWSTVPGVAARPRRARHRHDAPRDRGRRRQSRPRSMAPGRLVTTHTRHALTRRATRITLETP